MQVCLPVFIIITTPELADYSKYSYSKGSWIFFPHHVDFINVFNVHHFLRAEYPVSYVLIENVYQLLKPVCGHITQTSH